MITNLEQAKAMFGGKIVIGAMNASLNKTLVTMRKEAASQINKEYVVKVRDIKKSMISKRSRFSTLFVELTSADVRLPLSLFNPSQKRDGVAVKIKRGAGRQVLKRHFIAVTKSGHVGVFINHRYTRRNVRRKKRLGRRGPSPLRSELPIDESFTLGAPQMWDVNRSERVAGKRLQTVFQKELQHRINRAIAKSR